jgi:hypothetical protein
LARVRPEAIPQLTLSFGKVRRDDLIGDSQGSQRRLGALLGDFARATNLTG